MKNFILLSFAVICLQSYAQVNSYHDTQGKLEVSDNGQTTYTLPIALPASIQDVGPTINLVYSSGQFGGIAGQGWNINSISAISRIATRMDIDGYVDGVDFDSNDMLALDGQRLMKVSGNYWSDGSTYQTEVHSNSKIELKGTGNSIYFIVTHPDGSRGWYGNYGGMNATDITAYYITRFEDAKGNFITYHYNKPYNKSLCISEIKFSANVNGFNSPLNSIKFSYKLAKRVENAYIKGIKIEKVELLDNIEVFTNNIRFKKYQLTHITDPTLGYERVSQLQEFNGALEPANPVIFQYDTSPGFTNGGEIAMTYNNGIDFTEIRVSGDFDGDGKLDFVTKEKLHRNLFAFNSGEAVYDTPEIINSLSFAATTLKNNKVNQHNTIVNPIKTPNSLKLRFLDYTNGQVSLSYENSYPINNLITCNVSCPTVNCSTLGNQINPTHQFLEGDFNGDGKSDVLLMMNEVSIDSQWSPVGPENPNQDPNPTIPDPIGQDPIFNPVAPEPVYQCTAKTTISDNYSFRILNIDPNATTFNTFQSVISNSSYGFYSAKKYTGDFNGDGKTDLLVIYADKIFQIISFYNNGSSSGRIVLGNGILDEYSPTKQLLFGDYNGDGKIDIMLPDTEGGSGHNQWHIYYSNPNSNGADFFVEESHNIVEYWPDSKTYFDTQQHFSTYYAMDINDDGKSDLVRVWRKKYDKPVSINDYNTQWMVTGFANNIGNTQVSGNKFTLEYTSSWDHDHDSPDLVIPLASKYRISGLERDLVLIHNHANLVYAVDFKKEVSDDNRIKTVKASSDAIIDNIEYSPLINGSNYSSSTSLEYPFIELKSLPRSFVVAKLENNTAGLVKKQQFKYFGFSVHLRGLGIIGFKKSARSAWFQDPNAARIWNVKENNMSWRGATETTFSSLINGDFISLHNHSIIYNNQINKNTNAYSTSTVNGIYKIQLDSQTTVDYMTGVSTQVNYSYDSTYLLPVTVTTKNYTVNPSSPVGTKTTTTLFSNNPTGIGSNYFIGRPTETTTITSAYNNTFSTKEIYTYTNNKLTKTEKRGNTTENKYLIEEFAYNSVGNLSKKTLSNSGYTGNQSFAPRITEYTYDPTQRFIKTSKDIEGLITTNITFHPIYGSVLESKNPFGLTTKTVVDNWGKTTKVTDYLGKNGFISYVKSNGNYFVNKSSDDGSASVEISDVQGRPIKSGKKNINGIWTYISTEYDFYGRKYRVSEPYTNGSPTQWTTDAYDSYGRLISNTKHTGLTTTITYDGLTVSGTDGIKTTSSTKNANGHLVSSNDNGGVINFQYYADGNLKQSDYNGTVVSMEYDEWSRKKKLNDPSAGLYTYTYNALGEVLTETTPNGTTSYSYDAFGKITESTIVGTNTNSKTTYTYDPTTKLVTFIKYEDFNNGGAYDEYTYNYDAFQRLFETIENKFGSFYQRVTLFDGFGRPEYENYNVIAGTKQSTKWIRNTYKNGYHWQILDNTTNAILWQTNTVNARGQLTMGNLGNGIAISKTYDNFGYLTQSRHFNTSTPSNNLMSLNSSFEPLRGNLTSRYNSLFNRTENFEYDNLDRLKKYTNGQGIQVEQFYEIDGRIKQNDLGIYNYSDDSKKYQNTSVEITSQANAYYANRLGLFNDSMEQKTGWTVYYDPTTLSYDSTVSKSGSASLKMNNTTTSEKVVFCENWVKIDNTAPTQYTYSAWVKSDGSNPQAELFLYMKTENETNFATQVDNVISTTTTDWILIEKTFLVPANIKKIQVRLDNNTTGVLWYDDVRIRKTSDATPTERELNITYNTFKSPHQIEETGVDKISFTYNHLNNRSRMFYGGLQTDKYQRQYEKSYSADGSMEVKINNLTNQVEFITYIGGDAYSAPVVLKSDGTTQNYLYLHRDYQGSIVAISNQSGVVVEKRLFDAWGELLRVQDQQGDILAGLTVLDRGYTGHEHLQSVGLIHMNGRLYDAKLHRFLQPDNYIQDPYNTQNYNRYGYVLNNPLKYTDPSGEIITIGTAILIGAIIGGTTYTLTALLTSAPFSVGGFLKASFFGGLSGAVTFGIGTAVQSLPIAEKIVAGAFMHGTSQGIMTGIQGGDPLSAFVSGAVSSIAAGLWSTGSVEGKWQGVGGAWAKSDFATLAFGTFAGGAGAQLSGGNFWQGAVTGLVVSGLNHVAHKMGQRRSLLSRFKNKALAFQKADVSEAGIANLHQNVDGLAEGYEAGTSPTHSYDLEGNKYVAITENGNVNLNKGLLSGKNNLYFAGVLFHEYRHAFQYFAPYTVGGKNYASRYEAWGELYGDGYLGEGGKWNMMELDAYSAQYRFGDNQSYVSQRINKYYNAMLKVWAK